MGHYCSVRNYYLIIFRRGPCPVKCFFTVNNSNQSQSCNSGRASKCWLSPFTLRGYPEITVNIPLRGRTATHRSKKGSEKVLGRVLEKGSQKGSEKGACCGFYSKKGF